MPELPAPAPARPPLVAYDYALVRLVPSVARGDSETVGVVLHARRAGFLGVRLRADLGALAARWPGLDADLLGRYLRAFEAVAEGGGGAAPLGLLPPSERFHWLVATRSTVLQPGPVHTGLAPDPALALERIAARLGPARRPAG